MNVRRAPFRGQGLLGAIALLSLLQFSRASAGEAPDKSGYNLFHPTPDRFLRELVTDRPDKTESPYTVDAGHYQMEMDLLTYTYDRGDGGDNLTMETFSIAPINLKVGILNSVDLQIIAESYDIQRTKDRTSNASTRISGFGDLTLRCKTNLWGNDGGPTAFGIMPFAKIPTNQHGLGNGALEGGIIFPFAVKLPGEWDLGTELEIDYLQDAGSSDYHGEFVNSVTVGHNIAGKLDGYLELFSDVSAERGAKWIATFDFGFTYALTRDIQLDAGMNIGLTSAADDLNPFIGLSMRY